MKVSSIFCNKNVIYVKKTLGGIHHINLWEMKQVFILHIIDICFELTFTYFKSIYYIQRIHRQKSDKANTWNTNIKLNIKQEPHLQRFGQ